MALEMGDVALGELVDPGTEICFDPVDTVGEPGFDSVDPGGEPIVHPIHLARQISDAPHDQRRNGQNRSPVHFLHPPSVNPSAGRAPSAGGW
jgi:hypothetical protein